MNGFQYPLAGLSAGHYMRNVLLHSAVNDAALRLQVFA